MAGCGTTASAKRADATVIFVVVRHAEKGTDDARDPSLNDAGRTRAYRLAQLLSDAPLTAVYATAYRRTQQTAQPAADGHDIGVTTYDAKMSGAVFASQLRAVHARGTILVVGHSNSVPGIVAALSGTAVETMQDDQFDRIYRISIDPEGKATLSRRSY